MGVEEDKGDESEALTEETEEGVAVGGLRKSWKKTQERGGKNL